MRSSIHIVGLGEILWDIYPDKKCLGGAPANVAIHARRLGAETSIISAIGEDHLGDEILKKLKKEEIQTNYIQKLTDKPTGQVKVEVNQEGIPTFHCTRNQAYDFLQWEENFENLNADAIVIGTLAQRNQPSRDVIQKLIRTINATIVFDVNFRQWNDNIQKIVFETLPAVNILKINEEEKEHLKKALDRSKDSDIDFLEWMKVNFSLDLIALTLGSEGCILMDGEQIINQPGLTVQVKDTTGCGDAFTAGMLIKYLDGKNLNDTARFANALGSCTATQTGAVPEYNLKDVYKLMDPTQ